ncbi:MAG: orotate phosphoribosyltransferase, partial [Treponema sp.]|nr:orotate phosphoribosyltransferase [Treponema sp.]
SLNRMEKALDTDKSALDTITAKYGFPARAIVSMQEVVEYLHTPGGLITDSLKAEIDAYYKEWGAK